MQIINIDLPRRGGKTTSSLKLLCENENSIMLTHSNVEIDNPILQLNPNLKKRIFYHGRIREALRGKNLSMIIIDNSDLINFHELLNIINYCIAILNIQPDGKLIMTHTDKL